MLPYIMLKYRQNSIVTTPITKSQLRLAIERIMEQSASEYYPGMPPRLQKKFSELGDRVSLKIEKLLLTKKNHIVDIAHILHEWLKLIPQASPYYLEQEAKIRADEMVRLQN